MRETLRDYKKPLIKRLAVLDVSREGRGNVLGVGRADLTTQRLIEKMDCAVTEEAALRSSFLARARILIALPTDLDVIHTALATCWKGSPGKARAAVIPNTSRLGTLWVSSALVAEVDRNPDLVRETDPLPAPFLSDGSLDDWDAELRKTRQPQGAR